MVKVVCVLMQQIDIYFSAVIDIFRWLEISIISKSSVAIQVRRLNAAIAICRYFPVTGRRYHLIIVNSFSSIYFLNTKKNCDQVQKMVRPWSDQPDRFRRACTGMNFPKMFGFLRAGSQGIVVKCTVATIFWNRHHAAWAPPLQSDSRAPDSRRNCKHSLLNKRCFHNQDRWRASKQEKVLQNIKFYVQRLRKIQWLVYFG